MARANSIPRSERERAGISRMWLKSHDSLYDHPKVLRLSRDCRITRAHAVGLVHSLHLWTLRISPDGDLSSFDSEDIEIGAGWEGEKGVFFAATLKHRLIDKSGKSLVIHDWWDYAGSIKAAHAKRKQREDNRRTVAGLSQDCRENVPQERRERRERIGEERDTDPDRARESSVPSPNPEPETDFPPGPSRGDSEFDSTPIEPSSASPQREGPPSTNESPLPSGGQKTEATQTSNERTDTQKIHRKEDALDYEQKDPGTPEGPKYYPTPPCSSPSGITEANRILTMKRRQAKEEAETAEKSKRAAAQKWTDSELAKDQLEQLHRVITGHALSIDLTDYRIDRSITKMVEWARAEGKNDWLGAINRSYTVYLKSGGKAEEAGYPVAWWLRDPAQYLVAKRKLTEAEEAAEKRREWRKKKEAQK